MTNGERDRRGGEEGGDVVGVRTRGMEEEEMGREMMGEVVGRGGDGRGGLWERERRGHDSWWQESCGENKMKGRHSQRRARKESIQK